VFGLIVDIDDYEAGTYLQTKHATYREIQMWVKERYGLHVSNHAISQVKALCGLARDGPGGAEGQDGPKLRSDKEAAIREAFLWFGIIKRECPPAARTRRRSRHPHFPRQAPPEPARPPRPRPSGRLEAA